MNRPPPGSSLETYLREVEAEQAVQPASSSPDERADFRLDDRATERAQRHDPRDKQVADKPGGCTPRTPASRRAAKVDQRVAAVQAFLKTRREQGQQPGVSHNYRDWEPTPLCLGVIPGAECHCGFVDWRAEGGKIRPIYIPGHHKACEVCGRELRVRYWRQLGPILEAAGPLRLFGATQKEWTRIQRRLRKDGHQALPIPVDGGVRVFTTDPDLGEPVTDLPGQLAAELLAMTDDPRRRIRPTTEWREAWQRAQAEEKAARPAAPSTSESVGISGARSIPVARIWATHYGIVDSDDGGQGLVLRDIRASDPDLWRSFTRRVGIHNWAARAARDEGWARRGEEAA